MRKLALVALTTTLAACAEPAETPPVESPPAVTAAAEAIPASSNARVVGFMRRIVHRRASAPASAQLADGGTIKSTDSSKSAEEPP